MAGSLAQSQMEFSCAISVGQFQDMCAWVEANLEALHPNHPTVLDAIGMFDAEQRNMPFQHVYVGDRASPYYTGQKPVVGPPSVWAGERWDLLRAFSENWDSCCNGIYFATGFRFPAAAHLDRRGRPFRRGKANPYRSRLLTLSASLRHSMRAANDLVTEAAVSSLIVQQNPKELFSNWDWVGHGAFGDVFVARCTMDITPTLSLQQSLSFAYSRNSSLLPSPSPSPSPTPGSSQADSRFASRFTPSSIQSPTQSKQHVRHSDATPQSSVGDSQKSSIATPEGLTSSTSSNSTFPGPRSRSQELVTVIETAGCPEVDENGENDGSSRDGTTHSKSLGQGVSTDLVNNNSLPSDHDDDDDDADGVMYNPYEDDESILHVLMQVSSFSTSPAISSSSPSTVSLVSGPSSTASQSNHIATSPSTKPSQQQNSSALSPRGPAPSPSISTPSSQKTTLVSSVASYAASFFTSSQKKSRDTHNTSNSIDNGDGSFTDRGSQSTSSHSLADKQGLSDFNEHTAKLTSGDCTNAMASPSLKFLEHLQNSGFDLPPALQQARQRALEAIESSTEKSRYLQPSSHIPSSNAESGAGNTSTMTSASISSRKPVEGATPKTNPSDSSLSTLSGTTTSNNTPRVNPNTQTPKMPFPLISSPRYVAIKQVNVDNSDGWQAGMKETLMLSSCSHENVVGYLGTYFHEKSLWIVMEFCDGGTVAQLCSSLRLNEGYIAYICREVLKGLAFLHSRSRIHRDIKPANILLNLDGQVRIGDLGLLVERDDAAIRTSLAGTENFMAPEMICGEGYDSKADIWSLGCSILEMCNGKPPYKHLSTLGCLFRLATDAPPTLARPQNWSPELNDFVAQTLRTNPHKRPTAEQLLKHPFILSASSQEQLAALFVHVFLTKTLKKSGLM